LLNYLFLFYLATTVTEKKDRQNLIYLVFLVGILLSITGIYQFIRGNVVAGTMVNANILAGYLAMVIPSATGLILSLSNSINREFIKSHLFYFVSWLLMVACLFLTKSPGAIIGVVFGICVIIYFRQGKQIFVKFRYIFIVAALAAVVLVVLKLRQLQVLDRLLWWWGALKMVCQRPLIGVGLGGFKTAYARYKLTGLNPSYPYNYFLQLAAEMGVVGLGVFLWFLFTVGKQIKFLFRDFKLFSVEVGALGSIVAILSNNIIDYNLHVPANAILFWVLLGLLIATSRTKARNSGGGDLLVRGQRLGKTNKLLLTGVITFSILGMAMGITRLSLANRHYQLGKRIFHIGNLEKLVKGERNNLEKAEFEYGRAIELDPMNSWYHYGLAGVYLARYWREGYSSYLDEAIIEVREAVERMSYYGPFYANLSHLYKIKKDYRKAIFYMESAIACDRQNSDYRQRIRELTERMRDGIDAENN